MNYHRPITLLLLLAATLTLAIPTFSQDDSEKWLRVLTGEGSIIEVDKTSLILLPDRVIAAEFRTNLSTPEMIPGMSGSKYQTRFDLIQFSVADNHYRIAETRLLDTAGKVVSSSVHGPNDSKPITGRTASLLLGAAGQLAPFGIWRVVTYRYTSGEAASEEDPAELKSLVGSEILFKLDRMVVGKNICYHPVYSPKVITNEDFVKRVGSPLTALGLPLDKVDAILISCDEKHEFLPHAIILRLPGNRSLLLWDGVSFELERPGNPFMP